MINIYIYRERVTKQFTKNNSQLLMSQIVIDPSKNELKFTNSTVVKIVVYYCICVHENRGLSSQGYKK